MVAGVPQRVLGILSAAAIEDGVLKLTCGRLDRKDYMAVNKVVEAMGGKWSRKRGGHVFDRDPSGALDRVLLTGEVADGKREFQAFFTPAEVAGRLVEWAGVRRGDLCLEPSAGAGSILALLPDASHYCEIQQDLVARLQADGRARGYRLVGADFLAYEPGEAYDRVVANPPFTLQQDVKHVSHMIDCCKPGGRVVSVMSAGVTFRQDGRTLAFREKLAGCAGHRIVELGRGAFKESGTMVSTVAVIANK
jgi:predicted RNA methylase